MNVANLELSKKLYELKPEWKSEAYYTPTTDRSGNKKYVVMTADYQRPIEKTCPAYDLGFLIRKLPKTISIKPLSPIWLKIEPITDDKWSACACYRTGTSKPEIDEWADTPEDAAAKLCIALIENGLL